MADFILDPGEVIVERVNRYWWDLVPPFVVAVLLVLAAFFGLVVYGRFREVLPVPVPPNAAFAVATLLLLIAVLLVLSAVFVFIHNYILVTNKHLIKVQQSGLFARQTAELSLGNVEDVKGGRRGIFGTLFDFGDIEVQTAGASENFIFRTAHHPQLVADRLIQRSEDFRHVTTDPLP